MIKNKADKVYYKYFNFRLLNSEIGNDHEWFNDTGKFISHFRLLNSEIGNDLVQEVATINGLPSIFVSLTRR